MNYKSINQELCSSSYFVLTTVNLCLLSHLTAHSENRQGNYWWFWSFERVYLSSNN